MLCRRFSTIARKVRPDATPAIDCHTHMYTPKYMEILRKRTSIPRVLLDKKGENRLLILPGEDSNESTSTGRRIGSEYFSVESKLKFMDNHRISTSVISLANPWLDWLCESSREFSDASVSIVQELNDELEAMCLASGGRLFGLASLPVQNPSQAVKEIRRLKKHSHIKGFILGTKGAGGGIDHANFKEVLHEIQESGLVLFLHPHYMVGAEHFGGDCGHALQLALGFPFETTTAVARLIVSGRLEELSDLKLLVAHAGACLPGLAGRLDSCAAHDQSLTLAHAPSYYLKRMYFDAVSYGSTQLSTLIDIVGEERIVFGTDHPFFPPSPEKICGAGLEGANNNEKKSEIDVCEVEWDSAVSVRDGIDAMGKLTADKIYKGNAERIFGFKAAF